MSNSIISDDAFQSAKAALDGLSLRQQVIGQNIANIDTPGYLAQTVEFEDSLKAAMESNQTVKLEKTNSAHINTADRDILYLAKARQGGSVRADGNNVDLDTENAQLAEDAIRYETLSQLVSSKLLLLKSIVS